MILRNTSVYLFSSFWSDDHRKMHLDIKLSKLTSLVSVSNGLMILVGFHVDISIRHSKPKGNAIKSHAM